MVDNQWGENKNSELDYVNTEDLLFANNMNSQETYNCIGLLTGPDNFPLSQEIATTLSQYMATTDGQPPSADLGMGSDIKPDPEHFDQFPTLNNTPGDCDFVVSIPPPLNNSNWTYSESLNKIFIRRTMQLNLEVSYSCRLYGKMFLRVMIVYPDYRFEPVVRCNNHKVQNGVTPDKPGQEIYVMKCPHDNVAYVGTESGQTFKDRLALIFPLTAQQIKSEVNDKLTASVDVLFMCQNSCPTGINRRSTVLFLTLEDERGNMYGQKTINLKVCTVPRRDKQHEETQPERKKRKSSGSSAPSSSKKVCRLVPECGDFSVKSEHDAEDNTTVNQVQCERVSSAESLTGSIACKIIMPDRDSMSNVLHFAHNEIAGKIVDDPENAPRYGKFMKNIKKLQQSLPANENNN